MTWLERVRRFLKVRATSAGVNDGGTQFVGPSITTTTGPETTDLVVGLDFGTVCTKVVIRSPFAFGARATAVQFPGGDRRGRYLLPTILQEKNGRLDLGEPTAAGSRVRGDMKVSLMDQPSSADARARAAAYLGLVLRSARQWFLHTQRKVYGRFRLRWALNLGIPSAGYDDEDVRAAFGAVGRAAWGLSLRPDGWTLEAARAAIDGAGSERDFVATAVIPEIAAEVVGYAQSKHRRDGLHVMLDVGGSTIDICGFVLHSADGEDDRYDLLTALVERLGLHEIDRRRRRAVEREGERFRFAVSAAPSPFEAVPAAGRSYVDRPSRRLAEILDDIDEEYTRQCANAVMRVLMDLRKRRDPGSPHWESGLPIFIGGGGGRFELVTEALRQSGARLGRAIASTGGIRSERLPAIEALSNTNIAGDIAGRLDVAYGLSFDSPDIGQIVPPGRD